MSMTKARLLEIANEQGHTVTDKATKREIIEIIKGE